MVGQKKDSNRIEPGKDLVIPCACEWGKKDVKKKCCKKYKKGKQCGRCPKR